MINIQDAAIYVGTYSKYNNGSLNGKWMSLDDYDDIEDFYGACRELHKDEEDPEIMFQDWENIPERMVSECSVEKEIWDVLDLIQQGDFDMEIYVCLVDEIGYKPDEAIKIVKDRDYLEIRGKSRAEACDDFLDEVGLEEPDSNIFAIDWEQTYCNILYDFHEVDVEDGFLAINVR